MLIIFVLVVKVDYKQANKITSQNWDVDKACGVRKYEEGVFTVS